MNLMATFHKVNSPIPDWIIIGTIQDDQGNVIYDFGPHGTSLNQWWNSQADDFQLDYVNQFATIMTKQIVDNL